MDFVMAMMRDDCDMEAEDVRMYLLVGNWVRF